MIYYTYIITDKENNKFIGYTNSLEDFKESTGYTFNKLRELNNEMECKRQLGYIKKQMKCTVIDFYNTCPYCLKENVLKRFHFNKCKENK